MRYNLGCWSLQLHGLQNPAKAGIFTSQSPLRDTLLGKERIKSSDSFKPSDDIHREDDNCTVTNSTDTSEDENCASVNYTVAGYDQNCAVASSTDTGDDEKCAGVNYAVAGEDQNCTVANST